jgi:putative endonuclease
MNSYQKGLWAEYYVLFYLLLKGYRLIAQRYRNPLGEIDLILVRSKTLVLVEVKKRKTFSQAAFSLTNKQKNRMLRGALWFLADKKFCHKIACPPYTLRFDCVLVAGWKLKILSNIMTID